MSILIPQVTAVYCVGHIGGHRHSKVNNNSRSQFEIQPAHSAAVLIVLLKASLKMYYLPIKSLTGIHEMLFYSPSIKKKSKIALYDPFCQQIANHNVSHKIVTCTNGVGHEKIGRKEVKKDI